MANHVGVGAGCLTFSTCHMPLEYNIVETYVRFSGPRVGLRPANVLKCVLLISASDSATRCALRIYIFSGPQYNIVVMHALEVVLRMCKWLSAIGTGGRFALRIYVFLRPTGCGSYGLRDRALALFATQSRWELLTVGCSYQPSPIGVVRPREGPCMVLVPTSSRPAATRVHRV